MDVLILRRTQWFSVVWPQKEAVVNKSWEKRRRKKKAKKFVKLLWDKIHKYSLLLICEWIYVSVTTKCDLLFEYSCCCCRLQLKSKKVIKIQYHLLNTKLLLHKNSWNQGEMFIKLLTNCFSMVTLCHVSQNIVTKITQEHKFDNCHLFFDW